MDCVKCGAPLPAKSSRCVHCGSLNDVDLRALEQSMGAQAASDRKCPRCDVLMQSVDLNLGGHFFIERCDRCLGLFFDPGEMKRVLNVSTRPADEVDRERLQVMIEEEYREVREQVRYIKCPVCGTLMNRKSYGAKSGVIMDSCKQHGVWLDGGELAQIVKWKQVGGKLLDQRKKERQQQTEERKDRLEKKLERIDTRYDMSRTSTGADHPLVEIIEAVLRLW